MSDRQPNPADLTAYYQGLRISAQPFVPNVHAMPFQPGGGYPGGQHMYRAGGGMHYAMGGQGMYGLPPHMMVPQQQRHQHGYMGGPPNFGHPGMTAPFAPRQQHPPQHPMKPDSMYNPPSHGIQPDQSCRSTNKSDPSLKVKQKDPELPVKEDIPAEVDSWEERAEETSVSVSIEPVGTKGAVTNQDTPETINKPDTHLETERHLSEQASVHSENSNSPSSQERVPKTRDTPSSEPTPAKVHLAKTVTAPPKHENEKENVNIVFIGHVDAGKSTIGGHIMYLTGQVDKRTLEKYEREAKEKNRETWYLSWALDTNQEERDKGKTVEVGRAFFETDKKRFTILDAPGHSGFVPNMISGTVQADIGILVISARRGEFETGFEKGGQTREHAMLAKTAGVKHLVVLVNKMDDPTVGWSEERYEECKTKLTPFLKKVGFNPKTDLFFIPVSGLTGANLKEQCQESHATWYNGPAFIPYLDNLPSITREDQGPFRMPIADRYKDMGTVIIGKIESGSVCKGSQFLMMPNRSMIEVLSVIRVEEEVSAAYSGDNIKLKIKGVEEEDISPGFVMCSPHSPCHVGRVFDAQVVILEYKSIICAGFSCVLHIHSVVEEVEIAQLLAKIDKKTGKKLPEKPKFIKQDHTAIARFQTSRIICMEIFKEFPAMARFTLRDEGKTIAIGKVLKIIE